MAKQKQVYEKFLCLLHPKGAKELSKTNFYIASPNSTFGQVGVIMICRECCKKMFQKYYSDTKDVKYAVYHTCRKMDIAFINSIFEASTRESDGDWTRVFGLYMKNYNSLGVKNNWQFSFDNSENIMDTAEETQEEKDKVENALKLTSEEKRIKKEVMVLLDRDPFEGYSIADQKFLYVDLLGYLGEDSGDDKYKVSSMIQLSNNNNQINKCHKIISQNSNNQEALMENIDKIKSLNTLVKSLVDNNKKIAEDNGISEKHKKNSGAGKNTLADQMKNLREYGFEESLVNYHNQLISDSFKRVADISHRSILDQLMFDENDYSEIIATQRELVKNLEKRALEAEEKLRKHYEKVGANE